MARLGVVASEHKGLKILLLGTSRTDLDEIEARAELDLSLQRIDLYTADSIAEGALLAKKHDHAVGLIEHGTEGRDFVIAQLELHHANPNMWFVPLIDVPELSLIRESNKIGRVIDITDQRAAHDFHSLKNLVLSISRAAELTDISDAYSLTRQLQAALLVSHPDWKLVKNLSRSILGELLSKYDLSSREGSEIAAAEQLYFPWIQPADYITMLGVDPAGLAKYLAATSSWIGQVKPPTSVPGFLITLSNYVSERVCANVDAEELLGEVLSRPAHLKHPGIRALDRATLGSVIENTIVRRERAA